MNTDIQLKLATRIKQLRAKKKMTQEKLAELSGVDYKHIQLLESKNPPFARIDTLEKIALALKTSISKLLQ
ncbi:MAG: helix-turn-helix transcriptional regulator [Candidatus Omnitrophica bacterium]|nr:helix-turn-helix transcriptional regulator [Candidatus Omnitrophota bacterium]